MKHIESDASLLPELVAKIGLHEHLCLIYGAQEEQLSAAIPFLKIGLERGEKCLCIADANTTATLVNHMHKQGIMVDAAIRGGTLTITNPEISLLHGDFDPDRMIQLLAQSEREARSAGFSALRVIDEMAWVPRIDPRLERLIEYEAKVNHFWRDHDILGICQYDRRVFQSEVLLNILRTHPAVVYGGYVCENPYYTPPDELLHSQNSECELQRMLTRLQEDASKSGALRQSEERLRRSDAYLTEAQKLSHTGSFGWDVSSGEIYWSRETFRIFEYEPTAPVTIELVLQRTHPDDRSAVQKVIERVSRDRTEFEFEHRLLMPDGSVKHLRVLGRPSKDKTGSFEFVGAVTDVTDRKRAEDGLRTAMAEQTRLDAVRSEVGMALARKDSLKGILHACAEAMVHHLDAAFARIWTLTSDGLQLELQASAGMYTRLDGRYGRIPVGQLKIGLIAQERKAHLTNDVQNDPRVDNLDWARDENMTSFAGYPLMVEDRMVGVVGMFSRRVLTQRTLDTLAFISAGIAQGIERKRAEEKIRQAERQVRRVVDTIPALVWAASPDGLSNFFSQRWLEYAGLSLEEALGLGWTASIHPDDLEQLQAAFERGRAAGKPSEAEARVRGADGTYRWFLGRCVPLRDGSGQIEGWYGTATDIEDRKQAEQSLRRSEAYLAQAQRLSHTGSFGMRLSGEEIGGLVWQGVWSRETFRLLGLDETSKPSLETVLQHTHPEDLPLVRRAVEQAAQSGSGMDFEHRLVMSDGSIKHVHVVADAVRDDSGNLELVGAVQDITSSKKAFEEIRTLRDQLYQENVALREEVDKASMFEDIVGSSPALRAVLSRVSKVAPTDSTAFITGETGTGKELIARAIHRRSPRSSRAFVAVNCAVIPKELIASELFGHEKGAFTGALQRRVGRFELAQGGTLFLDEVGEIPPDTQVALLRVLQERRFERVGGSQSVQVDVRVIAATNRELDAAMNAGSFRRDLFYRLNVFPIQMPSLRERREDIPMLVEYFIDRFATKAGKRFSRINKKSLDLLQSYYWPGNIRELQNVIERSVILCETKEFAVDEHWLVPGPVAMEPKKRTLDEQLVREEKKILEAALAEKKRIIEAALADTGGKVAGPSGAAVKLGMPATTLYSKIQSMKIDRRRFRRS